MPWKDTEKRREYDRQRDRERYARLTPEQKKKKIASSNASRDRRLAPLTPQQRTERANKFPCRSPLARRKEHLKGRYGISVEQWETMFDAQGRCCAICKAETSGWKRHWHTDHCHATGKVRGILCHVCNRTLGHVNDDPLRLQAFIDYLASGA